MRRRRGCAPSTLTFHLRQLQDADLIEPRRQGASVIYAARPPGLAGLTDDLTEACCGGRPRTCLPEASDARLPAAGCAGPVTADEPPGDAGSPFRR